MRAREQTIRATGASWRRRAVLAVILGAAPTVWTNTATPPAAPLTPFAQRTGHAPRAAEEALQREVRRLPGQLVAVAQWHEPARNPFAWARTEVPHDRRVELEPALTRAAVSRGLAAALPFTLIGVAENRTGVQPERFAILAWNGEPVIAAEGARVGGRYVMQRIEADAIEVVDGDAASPVRLTFDDK
jgi:hypothetical protein